MSLKYYFYFTPTPTFKKKKVKDFNPTSYSHKQIWNEKHQGNNGKLEEYREINFACMKEKKIQALSLLAFSKVVY